MVVQWNVSWYVFGMCNTSVARKGYAVKVHGVEINPNPVIRGEEAKFSISATTGTLWTKKADYWFWHWKSLFLLLLASMLLYYLMLDAFLSMQNLTSLPSKSIRFIMLAWHPTVPSAVSRLGMRFALQLPMLTAPTLSPATLRPPQAVLVS